MPPRKPIPLLLAVTLALLGTLYVQAQTTPRKPAPKPLELTSDPQVILTEAPKAAEDQQIKLGQVPWATEPELEKKRQAAESNNANAKTRIDAAFDCGSVLSGKNISSTHFRIVFSNEVYMFYFRLTGVAGKTIRVDLQNLQPTNLSKMLTISPVVSEDLAPDEMPVIGKEAPFTAKTTTVTNGGITSIELPDTSTQSWHFIDNVWADQENKTISFVHTFTKNTALVAMKYPYSPLLNDKYLDLWGKSPHAKIMTIREGTTKSRSLHLIRITDIPEDQWKNHPSVVIYGREHADEHDNSWACKGAVDFLLSDLPEAVQLRQKTIFHIIPILDPAAAVVGAHSSMIQLFSGRGNSRKENIAYGDYFQQWIDAGGRLDLVLNLHNVESAERSYHLSVAHTEPAEARLTMSTEFDTLLAKSLGQQGFRASADADTGYLPVRLSGWLDDTFGALPLVYELNSQEPHRHLLLSELTAMGATLAKTAGNYVSSDAGKDLRESVDAVLEVRNAAKAAVATDDQDTVFKREYKLKEWRAQH